MAQLSNTETCFLRMENNAANNTRAVLEYAVSFLLKDSEGGNIAKYGNAVAYSIRPWALIFCSSLQPIQSCLSQALAEEQQAGGLVGVKRKYLEGIRLCCVKNANELRAILSSIHVPLASETKNDLITWMAREKLGHPPSLIVVIDLLDLLLAGDRTFDPSIPLEDRYLYIRYDQLAHVLALLVETCNYLDTHSHKQYGSPFSAESVKSTTLLITDNGILRPQKQVEPASSRKVIENLYHIIVYYLGNTVLT